MFDELSTAQGQQTDTRVLYRRWRPARFQDVVGQEHVTRTLRNAVKLGRIAHAYLFTGPRGTGKTSVARILYRAVNCLEPNEGEPDNTCRMCVAALEGRALDLVEIDAASNRGIDDMRDLRDKVAYRPAEGRYRVYIIDEAHELTTFAWDAFLKTLEEPPEHAIFVLATTEAHAVPATIVSRCQRFDFRRIPFAATREQLARVAAAEGMQVDPAVLERLALAARGGLRDALSLLDQLAAFAAAGVAIDMDVARSVLSLPSVEAVRRVVDGLSRRDASAVMADLDEVIAGGADPRLFVEELVINLRALLLVRSRADARLADEMPAEEADWLRERASGWTSGALIGLIQELSNALARTRDAQQFEVQVELALLAACELPGGMAAVSSAGGPTLVARDAPAVLEPPDAPAVLEPPDAPAAIAAAEAPTTLSAPDAPTPLAAPDAPTSPPLPEPIPRPSATAALDLATIQARWPDVVEHVTARKRMLGVLLSSAQPLGVEAPADQHGERLVVGLGTEFNLKRAELAANRQAIEDGVRHVFGQPYRLRCTLAAGSASALLDDPVISYAVRVFGGQPRRLDEDVSSEQLP
jgi:DNA polymerase-3 subunit gamma/tau